MKHDRTNEAKIRAIIKRLKRKDWIRLRMSYAPISEHNIFTYDNFDITLSDVLYYLKRKFKFKELSPQLQMIVGTWRFGHNDLRLQYKYCIDIIYYLVHIRLPKKPTRESSNETKD